MLVPKSPKLMRYFAAPLILSLPLSLLGGCGSGFDRIDRRTNNLIAETTEMLGGDAVAPRTERVYSYSGTALRYPGRDVESPATINPAARNIPFSPVDAERDEQVTAEANDLLNRVNGADPGSETLSQDALVLDLQATLALAMRQAREFLTAEEEYVLAALRLLVERHQWGPRFFDDVSANINASGNDGTFNSSLRVVNELRVTQRLPYGGDVSARFLAQATEDLHLRVAGQNVQSADIILGLNIPLLRGAGQAAREGRIQSERNLIYAARSFERFRRQFLVDIAQDFLGLVVQQQAIENAENQLRRLIDLQDREQALVAAGRTRPFQADLAAQDVLFARDRLINQREGYRLALDRFKVRLGIPVDTEIGITLSEIGLPTPSTDLDEAVRMALSYRLDLQTRRDQLEDSRRGIDNARNQLLPTLNFSGNISIPTDRDKDRAGVDFELGDTNFSTGLTLGLPLDREIERIQLRQSQINYERSLRSYEQFRDNIVVSVRGAIRDIERALFSIQIQEENIRIARRRQESIDADPDRSTARDRSDAADALIRAEDDRDRAARDLQVAILNYLLSTGTLRVDRDGQVQPLDGMIITTSEERRQSGETGPS